MDYEKKYEKLVDAVKVLRDNNPSDEGIQNWVNDNVPELAESDDEKIRKEIIVYLSTVDDKELIPYESWIAWLKKQDEQKPTDIVEPKFHKGDWVVREYDYTKDIITINQVVDVKRIDDEFFGYTLDDGTYFSGSWESSYRLWAIQDAKDGDVLQLGKVAAIFKEFIGNNNCMCYCSVYKGKFVIPVDDGFVIDYGCYDTHPATKEQRDLLFQKMHEAGYEWDAEKKGLNLLITNGGDFFESENCEQKPTWGEDDEKTLNRIRAIVKNDNSSRVEDILWLKSLKERLKGE